MEPESTLIDLYIRMNVPVPQVDCVKFNRGATTEIAHTRSLKLGYQQSLK